MFDNLIYLGDSVVKSFGANLWRHRNRCSMNERSELFRFQSGIVYFLQNFPGYTVVFTKLENGYLSFPCAAEITEPSMETPC